ncbi:MAG: exo-alpha-sialidase [Candidatus Omnitrophica bacterium]|nr:exo-alpha-sialidase [Candidatus Omnitrophota bacterium]
MRAFIVLFFSLFLTLSAQSEKPFFESEIVFDPEKIDHGHVHASCIVECPNGDLRTCWYENGTLMPEPYYSDRKDKSDDVRIGGSRLAKGADSWEAPFVMADTFACSDNNPCMSVDKDGKLWLFYPTLLGVPENTWGSALMQFKISDNYDQAGPPVWKKEAILVPKPVGIADLFKEMRPTLEEKGVSERMLSRVESELEDPLKIRLGWMSRAHALVRSDGAIVLPLANENFGVPVMAITNDNGETWTFSKPVPYMGLIQPSIIEWEDGKLTAFFRSDDDNPKIPRSDSTDGGITWSPPTRTELDHPGSGLEAMLLDNGHLAVVYNDKLEDPRDRLAISISDDKGKTFKWKRHIEDIPGGRFDYPSVIQAKDGSIHVSYSYNLETVKHVRFNEAWVMEGDN